MKNKTSENILRFILAVVALLYIAVVIKILFVKNGVRTETNALVFKPFKVLAEYGSEERSLKSVFINYLGNICLFAPLGLLLPAVFKKLNFWKTAVIGLLLALLAETLQYFTASGYADIDDVLANTIGFILGAIIYFFVFDPEKKEANDTSSKKCQSIQDQNIDLIQPQQRFIA